MKQKAFVKLVGTTSPTLRIAMKRNPELARAIKVAVIGDESEIDARAEWYMGALPSKKGKSILENEFGVYSLEKIKCARAMWQARLSYWITRCSMLSFAYLDNNLMPVQRVIDLATEFFARARKAQLVEFLIINPDLILKDFHSKWDMFEWESERIVRYVCHCSEWLNKMLKKDSIGEECKVQQNSGMSVFINQPMEYEVRVARTSRSFFSFDPVGTFAKLRIDPFRDAEKVSIMGRGVSIKVRQLATGRVLHPGKT